MRQTSRSGSALLLVLLVIAGIVTLVFASQRLSLVQFNQSVKEEDNLFAYYAAKAGLEDGLMRFRASRDVQTQANKVFRFDLTNGLSVKDQLGVSTEIPNTTPINQSRNVTNNYDFSYSPIHQDYDLGINFQTQQVGFNSSLTDFDQPLTVAADDFLELTGFPADAAQTQYYLRYLIRFSNADGSDCLNAGARAQIQQVTQAGFQTPRIIANNPGQSIDSITSTDQNFVVQLAGGNTTTVFRIRPFGCGIKLALSTSLTSTGKGGTTESPTPPPFDSTQTTITATGYYGAVKRTLVATVDRRSGQLLNIFDFNAFAGHNLSP